MAERIPSRELDADVAEALGHIVDRDWPMSAPAGDAYWYEPENAKYFESIGVRPHRAEQFDKTDMAIRETSPDGVVRRVTVPYFSSDIAASFHVVEALRAKGWTVTLASYGVGWYVTFDQFESAHADTLPLAICLASLKAVEAAR